MLKNFIAGFKDVSTKYLNNYLIWNNILNYSKETWTEKKNILKHLYLQLKKDIEQKCSSKTSVTYTWIKGRKI